MSVTGICQSNHLKLTKHTNIKGLAVIDVFEGG